MVFTDSNIFISIWDRDNVNHEKALAKSKHLEEVGESIIVSNITVYEVATVLSMRVSKAKALEFLKSVNLDELQVVLVDEDLDSTAKRIFKEVKNKNVSFFDCTSFAVIEKYKIDKIFSFDKDFERYGKKLGWEFV